MTWFAASRGRSRVAFLAATAASMAIAEAAFASQGPGTGPGAAGSLTQLAMAIIVYGSSALVVAAGLIGAARGRHGGLSPSNQKYRKQPHAK